MSAWMVSNETLSRIANDLVYSDVKHFANNSPLEIFNELANMNIEALKSRYNDYEDMVGEVRYMPDVPRFESQIQLLKSLHCYKYQCTEGKVPNCKTYKSISEYIGYIADKIATSTKEYSEAYWG